MFRIGEGRGKWIYIYFIIFDGNEKKKFIKDVVVGKEKKRGARRRCMDEVEPSVVVRGDEREQRGSGVGSSE